MAHLTPITAALALLILLGLIAERDARLAAPIHPTPGAHHAQTSQP